MNWITKITQQYHRHPKRWLLTLAFLIPIILMGGLFIGMKVFPFGDNTLLTVDLGQQYLDFYQYYRHFILSGFEGGFYSFSKSIGGEMLGTWAYYLMSPFMLVTLLFPGSWLSVAIAVMILLKLGTAAWSFQWMLGKIYDDYNCRSLTFSLMYAFIGYLSANQLNVMWLDGVIFLPLVIWGIDEIFTHQRWWIYTLSLALVLWTNYYIGYMVCLFSILFFIYRFVVSIPKSLAKIKKQAFNVLQPVGHFIIGSLLAGGLAAILLVPTFQSLLASKGAHETASLDWSLAYPFQELLSKWVIGSFNFNQMPDGLPNLFVGSLGIVMLLTFLMNRRFHWSERFTALSIISVLLVSMNTNALNTIWHGWQDPIWYPYRFSFVWSFFVLYIGYRQYRQLSLPKLRQNVMVLLLGTIATLYLLMHVDQFDEINALKICISFGLFTIVLLLTLLISEYPRSIVWLLLALTLGEGFANSALNVTSLGYLDYEDVVDPIIATQPTINTLRPNDQEFYRITKDYQRTKNDGLHMGYYDLNQFNSTLEKGTTELFKSLGFPSSEVFTNYTTGTLFTDDFFGVRYMLVQDQLLPNPINGKLISTRYDWLSQPITQSNDSEIVTENEDALGLGFSVNKDFAKLKTEDIYPIYLQDQMLQALDNKAEMSSENSQTQYFSLENFQSLDLENVATDDPNHVAATYSREKDNERSLITVTFTPDTDDAYYLTVPQYLNDDDVTFFLNGQELAYDDTFRSTQIYNLANNDVGQTKTFQIEILADAVTLQDFNLYRLDKKRVANVATQLKDHSLQLDHFSDSRFSGKITTTHSNDYLLLTFPYSKGWHFKVDGNPVTAKPHFSGGLTLLPLSKPGTHEVTAYYRPPGLILGGLITISSIVIIGGHSYYYRKHQKSWR